MTSISGVTFISIIGSPEALSLVVCIDMAKCSYWPRSRAGGPAVR